MFVRTHMNKTQKILISLFAIAFISCGRDYQLGKEDLNYIPYVGNEILIFNPDTLNAWPGTLMTPSLFIK